MAGEHRALRIGVKCNMYSQSERKFYPGTCQIVDNTQIRKQRNLAGYSELLIANYGSQVQTEPPTAIGKDE
jgi:hypothetical protein